METRSKRSLPIANGTTDAAQDVAEDQPAVAGFVDVLWRLLEEAAPGQPVHWTDQGETMEHPLCP